MLHQHCRPIVVFLGIFQRLFKSALFNDVAIAIDISENRAISGERHRIRAVAAIGKLDLTQAKLRTIDNGAVFRAKHVFTPMSRTAPVALC